MFLRSQSRKMFVQPPSDFAKQQAEIVRQRGMEIQREKCHTAGVSCHQSDCEQCYPK